MKIKNLQKVIVFLFLLVLLLTSGCTAIQQTEVGYEALTPFEECMVNCKDRAPADDGVCKHGRVGKR